MNANEKISKLRRKRLRKGQCRTCGEKAAVKPSGKVMRQCSVHLAADNNRKARLLEWEAPRSSFPYELSWLSERAARLIARRAR